MNAHGITFQHRHPANEPWVAKDYAEFTAFASLCAAAGVAQHVRNVFFDTKWQGFNLDVDPRHEHTDVHMAIEACGRRTLPQFILFGAYLNRDGADVV